MKTDQESSSFDYYLRLHEATLLATVLEHVESDDGVFGTTSWVRFTTAAAVRREPNPPLG